MTEPEMSEFEKELSSLINMHSMENGCNTPDFILAQYTQACLDNFNKTTIARDNWYDVNLEPGEARFMHAPSVADGGQS